MNAEQLMIQIKTTESLLEDLYEEYNDMVSPCFSLTCEGYDKCLKMNCAYFNLVTECPDYKGGV